jgi:hypothetical protein
MQIRFIFNLFPLDGTCWFWSKIKENAINAFHFVYYSVCNMLKQ